MRIYSILLNVRKVIILNCFVVYLLIGSSSIAQNIVGQTSLNIQGKIHDVLIEDVSPDYGSTAELASTHYATPWGVSLAVSRSGRQLAASPAAGWITENGPVYVDHVATVDTDGRLIVFYWSPPDKNESTETEAAAWKAVDISEKTSQRLVAEQPGSWRVQLGKLLHERVVAIDINGRIKVFSWSPGKDWTTEPVSSSTDPSFDGPVTAWTSYQAGQTEEYVAARTNKHQLILYTRAGTGWARSDITSTTKRSIAGSPQGWLMTDGTTSRIATHDASQHLLLFTRAKGQPWDVTDLTATTNGQAALGPVTAWEQDGVQQIASRSPNGDLLIFTEDPIDAAWSVENISEATKIRISAGPVHWSVKQNGDAVLKLAAPDYIDHIQVFWRGEKGQWMVEDLTAVTGLGTPHRLTAWTTPSPIEGVIEHLAAPTSANFLHVFSKQNGGDWNAVDLTTRTSGRVVYAATPWAGVFVSRNYGVVWKQSTRPQPGITDKTVPGALPVPRILDVAVSPDNPDLVFAAADREGRGSNNARTTSAAGIYRSDNGGKSWELVYTFTCGGMNRPVTQIEFAPDDSKRIYAAGYCGIARSTDGGGEWKSELSPPNTFYGASAGNRVLYHLAVSEQQGPEENDRVLIACGPQNIWFSREDGEAGSWIDDTSFNQLPDRFCGKTGFRYINESAAEILSINPENAEQVYYAYHSWANGPSYHHKPAHGYQGVACNIPVIYDIDDDMVTSSADTWIRRERQEPPLGSALGADEKIRFVDLNGDSAYTVGEPVYFDTDNDSILDQDELLIEGAEQPENTPLSSDRLIRYLNGGYGDYDLGFGPRQCGEGSLWIADYSEATETSQAGVWIQLPGPPVYYILFGTGSGSPLVQTVPTPKGHLVFFADSDTLHVSEGLPTAGGWYRLDGMSIGEAIRYGLDKVNIAVHADPRGLAVSEGFDLELQPADQEPPYNLESDLRNCNGGRVWLSNDGGVYSNADCGKIYKDNKTKIWQATESGLHILWSLNILGAAGRSMNARGLYTGTTHDDDFSSVSNGNIWASPVDACGDCDTWFGDLYQRNRVVRFNNRGNDRKGEISIFENNAYAPPDPSLSTQLTRVKYPNNALPLTISSNVIRGARYVIQTLKGNTPPANGDYLVIVERSGDRKLMRAYDSLDDSAPDSGFTQIGPDLPANVRVVQASGGHTDPVFFVGDGASIWRWDKDHAGVLQWTQIVPSATAPRNALRFFVDPWRPEILYLIDDTLVRRSVDSGNTWVPDNELTNAVSGEGEWRISCDDIFCLINDMAFDPENATRRFAAGVAGVYYTAGGKRWTRLVDTRALPSRPLSLWFDPLTDPLNDTLIVGSIGRGVLTLSPIPDKDPLRPVEWLAPPSHDPVDFRTWTDIGSRFQLTWSPSGAASVRSPLFPEIVRMGRRRILSLGDGSAMASGKAQFSVACDGIGKRIVFHWRAYHDRNREVPDAVDVQLSDEESMKIHALTLGAEQSSGSWSREEIELSPNRCGNIEIAFVSRYAKHRNTRFEIGGLSLQRINKP